MASRTNLNFLRSQTAHPRADAMSRSSSSRIFRMSVPLRSSMRPNVTYASGGPGIHLYGSYRIAIAPEPNSRRFTSFKSICFGSPAARTGP